jgi:hypothetical protein
MKKAIVLLLALAILGGAVFAQEASISGYGQVKWGYNLNNDMHGFTNSYGLTIDVPLNTNTSASSTGEGVYGTASATNVVINVSVDDDVAGTPGFDDLDATVSAKIIAGALTTTIYSKPSLSLNNASHFGPWKDDDADYADHGVRFNPTVGGGLTFAYALADLGTFTAKLASRGDATAYADDMYAFTGGIVLTPVELITLTLGGGYDMETKAAGATAKVALAPAEGITSYVGFDLYLPDGADAQYDGRFNVTAAFGKLAITADANYKEMGTKTLDAKLAIVDSGSVPGLSASVAVFAMDLLAEPANDPMFIGLANSVSYQFDLSETTYVKPYEKAVYDLANEMLYLSAGASAKLIDNTVFTLDYTSGTLVNQAFPAGMVGSQDKGKITFTTKITF